MFAAWIGLNVSSVGSYRLYWLMLFEAQRLNHIARIYWLLRSISCVSKRSGLSSIEHSRLTDNHSICIYWVLIEPDNASVLLDETEQVPLGITATEHREAKHGIAIVVVLSFVSWPASGVCSNWSTESTWLGVSHGLSSETFCLHPRTHRGGNLRVHGPPFSNVGLRNWRWCYERQHLCPNRESNPDAPVQGPLRYPIIWLLPHSSTVVIPDPSEEKLIDIKVTERWTF